MLAAALGTAPAVARAADESDAPLAPYFSFQGPILALQVLDLGGVQLHDIVEQNGRYVDRTAPGAALGLTHPAGIGVGFAVHVAPFARGRLGLVASGAFAFLGGRGVPTDAATYDAMGRPTPLMTEYATLGPEYQSMVGEHMLVRASVGLGGRWVDMHSAGASSFLVQPRLALNLLDAPRAGHSDGEVGAFVAVDAYGAGGHAIVFGLQLLGINGF
jgi:hypothetical protein